MNSRLSHELRSVSLALTFVLCLSTPAYAAKGDKGKGGGGNPGDTPAMASFLDILSGTLLEGDGMTYFDGALNGGWAKFVGTGNFALKTSGKKKTRTPRTLTLEAPALNIEQLTNVAFTSVNDSNCDDGECTQLEDFRSGNRDGLRSMPPFSSYFVRICGSMDDPDQDRVTYHWHCGPHRKTAAGVVDHPDTSYFQAECTEAVPSDPDRCRKWHVLPSSFPTAGGGCRIERETSGKGRSVTDDLGLHPLAVDLTIELRDE